MKRFILAGLLAAALASGAIAQDAGRPADCPTGDVVVTALASMAAELTADGAVTLALLDTLRAEISAYTVACTGLAFSSERDGMQPVIGPVVIPEGIYRVTATTASFMIAHITALQGECGDGYSLFNVTQGNATNGVQAVFESAGCEALIEVSNTREAWTLEFEKLR